MVLFLLALGETAFSQQEVLVLGATNGKAKDKLVLSGRVLDAASGEPLPGAVLRLQPIDKNDVTTTDGSFKLTMPPGIYTLAISNLGYSENIIKLQIIGDAQHDFKLVETSIELEQITVTEIRSNDNVREVMPGVEQLSIEQMGRQAKFLGETDVLRSLQSMSGVTSVGEGASGFNVRGGNTDENLILMDGNLVFNPVHALGFFSLFHPDMVQGVTLYKGGVPAKYGGRLSSVLDVRLREGDDQRLSAKGGVGIATSRLVLEGPIVKNKASFIVGARASYVDWMLKRTNNIDLRKSQAFFYDLTAKMDARLSKTTKFGFTAFNTHDDFQFADEVKFEYATSSVNAYLKQLVGQKINLTAQVNAGAYQSDLFDVNGNDQSKFTNHIWFLRGNFGGVAQLTESYHLEAGIEQTRYRVSPGKLSPLSDSNVKPDQLADQAGFETSYYLNNEVDFGEKFKVVLGGRHTIFNNRGPGQVYLYEPGAPKGESTITDSLTFAEGEEIARYTGFEPRLSIRFSISDNSSFKAGYNRSYQYFSQVSNTASATPIDIWQLSNYHVKPQRADNFSFGYHHNFKENIDQTYLAVFYRKIENLIDYKDFARLLLNRHLETELVVGQGKAYGVEFFLKKSLQNHQFELNYTFSRTLRKVERSGVQAPINRGDWYPSNYDKPHSFNLNYFWKINPKSSFSANFTYSTGRPTTAPVSSFSSSNVLTAPVYSERNQFRIPDYHRLDAAYAIGPWGKRERWRNSLTFSIYNLYFRKNAFSVFFRQKPFQRVTAYRVAVLGSMFPAVTYDVAF